MRSQLGKVRCRKSLGLIRSYLDEIFWIRGKGHIHTFLFPDGAIKAVIRFLYSHMKGKIAG
jgi:hypothetical protein